MRHVRGTLWGSAFLTLKAAYGARQWAYYSDPLDAVSIAENDREALRLFQRDRDRARGRLAKRGRRRNGNKRARPVPQVKAGTRRSERPRKRPRHILSSEFAWNYGDEYVMDLDERSWKTKADIDTENAHIKSRRWLAMFL